jgi:phosphatidylserine/phosphatidylglycerophosphate/cardiolipin synthase-like enzyme
MGCNPPPDEADLESARGGRVEIMFNDPGTRAENLWDPDAIDVMIEMIDGARASIHFAVMGFSEPRVVDAFIRAYDRGIDVQMVGDAGHLYNSGYNAFMDRHIPMQVGNLNHIMHDKFMVVDDRFVFCGTANWTPTDLIRNSNNFVTIDSPEVAADFETEFDQMFNGLFGHNKLELPNGRRYQVGDTEVEVWFSPNEDAMGRIREVLGEAKDSVRFTIFAFTKNEVGSDFIRLQDSFLEKDLAEGLVGSEEEWNQLAPSERRTVAGVVDQSQLHSNGQYHEVYRLLAAGVPMQLDGNDNSRQPGDYQAGGGRLHSKTMVIDAYGEEPTVITGSFNWSASATSSNDEFLLVMRGARVAELYDQYFERLYLGGRSMGNDSVAKGTVLPGDVIINEVMWYGVHSEDEDGFDEFIELKNTTDRTIDLSMWQISNETDVVVGLPPGSVIGPGDTFLILDHVNEPYVDGRPQDEWSAYLYGDLVVNSFNDNRQHRLYLKDGSLELILRDPGAVVIDRAGDGGAAFAGGPDAANGVVRSMERKAGTIDGADPNSWYACTLDEGAGATNPDFAGEVIGTPGAENSAP